jgi:ribosome-binding factor A
MADNIRVQRIGDEIQRIVGNLLIAEVNDPRLKFLSITGVEVSRDLSYAKIFYSSAEESFDATQVKQALTKASGFFRKRIAEEVDLRIVPKLNFVHDNSIAEGQHISTLIDAALASDASKDESHS